MFFVIGYFDLFCFEIKHFALQLYDKNHFKCDYVYLLLLMLSTFVKVVVENNSLANHDHISNCTYSECEI